MMRTLLVEDDQGTADAIRGLLDDHDIRVNTAGTGEDALSQAQHYEHDIVILDLNLPDMTGYKVLEALKVSRNNTPVIITSGHAKTEDKVEAMTAGATDYLTKPFHGKELIARIQSIVRRACGHSQSIVTVGNLSFDLETREATIYGEKILLPKRSEQILGVLALYKNSPFAISKETIIDHIWDGTNTPPGDSCIDQLIGNLRKSIAQSAENGLSLIQTEWGQGFKLRAPESPEE